MSLDSNTTVPIFANVYSRRSTLEDGSDLVVRFLAIEEVRNADWGNCSCRSSSDYHRDDDEGGGCASAVTDDRRFLGEIDMNVAWSILRHLTTDVLSGVVMTSLSDRTYGYKVTWRSWYTDKTETSCPMHDFDYQAERFGANCELRCCSVTVVLSKLSQDCIDGLLNAVPLRFYNESFVTAIPLRTVFDQIEKRYETISSLTRNTVYMVQRVKMEWIAPGRLNIETEDRSTRHIAVKDPSYGDDDHRDIFAAT